MVNTICKPPSFKIRPLANHFVKLTNYMTEESEHYVDRPRLHKLPTTLLDLEYEGTNHPRPHWIQNPAHKISILQGLSYSERSPRSTLPKQSTSRDFS
jgi:hypothetical protein